MHLNCLKCGLWRGCRTPWIRGRGPIPCEIMLIGEAPGESEDGCGKPFVGRAGKLLEGILDDIERGLKDRVYLTNAVRCRPTKGSIRGIENRTPNRREVELCGIFLRREISVVQPRLLICLGATAISGILGKAVTNVSTYRLTPLGIQGSGLYGASSKIWVTYHPAFALRSPGIRGVILEDIKRVLFAGAQNATNSVPVAQETEHQVSEASAVPVALRGMGENPVRHPTVICPTRPLATSRIDDPARAGREIWVVDIETNDWVRGRGPEKPFQFNEIAPKILVECWEPLIRGEGGDGN